MPGLDWLDTEHGVYEMHADRWRINERRLRGGEAVLEELRPFSWEYTEAVSGGPDVKALQDSSSQSGGSTTEHYERRQAEAVYVNFPDMFATAMTGFLLRQAPEPGSALNFGTLGEVGRTRTDKPTAAELVYFNVDGAGNDGSQWDAWWLSVYRRAFATGHRWLFCEAPMGGASSEQDWLEGRRPYLTEFSPLQVPLWHIEDGVLKFAVVRFYRPSPKIEEGTMVGLNPEDQHYMLLVAQDYEGLGDEFKGGGWWLFDPEKESVEFEGEGEAHGDWSMTNGQIPLWPVFYDRDRGTTELPSFSRPAITELGQLAVSYMNLGSAWDFDVWDAGGSVQLLLGTTKEAFNITAGLLQRGNKMVPVPQGDGMTSIPQVYDASLGAVSSEVFTKRLESKRDEARELAAMESTATPESSGVSKRAGFADLKSPRLALMASELEQAQNTAIHFLEMRFGNPQPQGSVAWDREFELIDALDEIRELFSLEVLSKLRSSTAGVQGMMKVIRERGIITDDKMLSTIEGEYQKSAGDRDTAAAAEATLERELGA